MTFSPMPKFLKKSFLLAALLPALTIFSAAEQQDSSSPMTVQDPRDSDSPFGVNELLEWNHPWNNYHYDTDEKMEKSAALMEAAGVEFIRHTIICEDVEPTQGHFEFEKYDKILTLLERHHIKVLCLLQNNASWTSHQWNEPPDPSLYAAYAKAVAHHYKGRIKYWEVWNEPDSATFWNKQDGMKAYTQLLKEVYRALKEEDPTCKVMMGGLTDAFSLQKIYGQGGKDSFDIVNLHPYVNPSHSNALGLLKGIYQTARRFMDQHGDNQKPIWFTEIGCPGVKDPEKAPGWWEGKSQDEKAQAQWVSEVYGLPLGWEGVEKIFWFVFRDTDNYFNSGTDYFGLLTNDFTPKPAYRAYQEAAAPQRSAVRK